MHEHSARTRQPPPRHLRGLSEIASDYDVLLCDVWGVIHNGVARFEKAVDAAIRFRDQGGQVVLITNAPRPRAKIVNMLDRLAVPREAYDGIVSSGDVTVAMIVARGGAPLAHIGPSFDESLFVAAEELRGQPLVRVPIEEASYVVCTGLKDYDRDKPADYEAQLRAMKARGLDFICANPDLVVEVGKTLYYCAGALAELYEAMGGTVVQAGKPYAPIYERAIALAAEARGSAIGRGRVLAIGDGINTDIKGGMKNRLDTLFVTSGIHRPQLQGVDGVIDRSELQKLCETSGVEPLAVLSELVW
jgi:HAD superfamily hydrolase (TIGR01459 family)